MKNLMFSLGLAVIVSVLLGCPKPQPKNGVFTPGSPFTINYGQTMQTSDGKLSIRFDDVTEDSRCPVGVQCVWAGRVDANFTLTSGSATQTVALSSGSLNKGGTNEAEFSGYKIKLEGMEPLKKADAEIEPKNYKATLLVTQ